MEDDNKLSSEEWYDTINNIDRQFAKEILQDCKHANLCRESIIIFDEEQDKFLVALSDDNSTTHMCYMNVEVFEDFLKLGLAMLKGRTYAKTLVNKNETNDTTNKLD